MHPWIIYANEISRDRERRMRHLAILDEERHALATASPIGENGSWHVRRSLARALATTTRLTASVVRRLDDCVADDLGHSLAPTE